MEGLDSMVVVLCLGMLVVGSLCQDDAAVYIVTLKQAPASHLYIEELNKGTNVFKHGGRAKPHKPRNNNSTSDQSSSSYIARVHNSLLRKVLKGEKYLKLYSYHYLINGFAVLVTPAQADKISRRGEVANVALDFSVRTATTYTPQFLGLPRGAWVEAGGGYETAGEGIVIGFIDTGIDPTHPSFASDHASETSSYAVPSHFSGICEVTRDFPSGSCNGKLIGARHFAASAITRGIFNSSQDYASPFDGDGHGTVAIYKSFGGFAADVVAAIDQAAQDGVDIISLSITPNRRPPGTATFFNPIDMALLSAVKAGIFVVQAAGNTGPSPKSMSSFSPWILTLGAASHDRAYANNSIILGNNLTIPGVGLAPGTDGDTVYTPVSALDDLTSGTNVASGTSMAATHVAGLAALATSDNLESFLQCLPKKPINSSYPISDEAIYTPANASFTFTLETYIHNRRFLTPETPKPLAIVTAKHESHVQATIVCAKNHGLQMKIRSGGHDYEGLSFISDVPFVILDMFNLRSIEIDIQSETAWVQAGATVGELYYNIANLSNVHAFPAGICPTVATGGHISGGGYGNLMRKYGLSIDHIIDAQVVDVNGNILNRETMGEDFFWAIRGGGGASFGVILSWKIQLVRVPPKVTYFRVDRTLAQGATDILYRWQQVAAELDRNLFIRTMPQVINVSGTNMKTIMVSFYGGFLGESDTLLALMNTNFPELGLQQSDCKEMRWIESTLFWQDLPAGTSIESLLERPSGAQGFTKNKSDYVKKVIPKYALRKIWKIMIQVGNIWMQWNPYGGIMSEILETATPYPHRAGVLFKIQYATFWDDEKDTERYVSLLRKMFDVMTPYASKDPRGAFLNYRDIDIGSNPSNDTNFLNALVYGSKHFKGNFQRLVIVKGRVDPNNFFRNEQSIPPPLTIS